MSKINKLSHNRWKLNLWTFPIQTSNAKHGRMRYKLYHKIEESSFKLWISESRWRNKRHFSGNILWYKLKMWIIERERVDISIAIGKEHESIAVELREMETKNRHTKLELLAKVSKSKRKIEKWKERHQRKSKNICFKCGNELTTGRLKNCSALGRKSNICGKLNHLASACRSKEQYQVKYKNSKSKKVNKIENTTSYSENSSESSSESDFFVIFEKCNQNKIEKNRVNSMNKTKSKSALIKISSKNIPCSWTPVQLQQ